MRAQLALLNYLNVIVAVVVHIEDPVDFRVDTDADFFRVPHSFGQICSRVFLHLDVVEFPEAKGKDQLWSQLGSQTVALPTVLLQFLQSLQYCC